MKPRRRLFAAQVREAPSVTLLVHGTFAGAPEDRGEKWWQCCSPVAQRLQNSVPRSVEVAPSNAVFHWSGENSERARSKAAYALLNRLIDFERSHEPYHLVGHSHGGSVIWNTLKLATIKRIELSQLRSWTTVGTPFLQHRSRNAWNPVNLAAIVFGLLLLRPAYRTLWQISILLWNAATGSKEGLVLPWDRDSQTIHFFESPVLAFLQWIGIPMEFSSAGVRVGSFDPNGSQSLAAYLFATGEGLFFFSMAVLAAYLFLMIGLMCIRPAIESYRIRAEQRLEDDAFAAYQSRWLGIWSTDDEAINGLRATLDLTMSFLGKLQPQERVFFSDNLSLLSRPFFWLAAPIYNYLLQPLFDASIRSIVARSAQGNDRPTANIIDVSPCPFGPFHRLAPPLPADLNEHMCQEADRAACEIAPKLRRLLGSPSFTHGLEVFGKELSGDELIHTAYFDHEEILNLIACNIGWGTSDTALRASMERLPSWLSSWFATTKSQLQSHPGAAIATANEVIRNEVRRAA